jgi:hypothetical protein
LALKLSFQRKISKIVFNTASLETTAIVVQVVSPGFCRKLHMRESLPKGHRSGGTHVWTVMEVKDSECILRSHAMRGALAKLYLVSGALAQLYIVSGASYAHNEFNAETHQVQCPNTPSSMPRHTKFNAET